MYVYIYRYIYEFVYLCNTEYVIHGAPSGHPADVSLNMCIHTHVQEYIYNIYTQNDLKQTMRCKGKVGVRMYVCMYVCTSVCMCVYTYIHVRPNSDFEASNTTQKRAGGAPCLSFKRMRSRGSQLAFATNWGHMDHVNINNHFTYPCSRPSIRRIPGSICCRILMFDAVPCALTNGASKTKAQCIL